jgi:hypothetical protein
MTDEELNDVGDINPEAIIYDGYNDAIIGMASRINLGPVVAYDVDKILEILVERDGMTYEEAMEYFDFNIMGGWLGEYTPIFITKLGQ